MNESNIRLAIFYIPPVVAATIFLIKWQAGRIAARKEVELQRVRETSVGETAIEKMNNKVDELNDKLDDAGKERRQMKEDLREMKEEFRHFKEEIRKHGIEAINETISKLERLNKNK
jgi:peptidoglycan hydrolase CwlO-like protein